ncbi:hypothetical protein BUALT_Bualt16G0075100 [Buddleja alternifolia]|uniref:Uncharacterized protein n=1 Tax=Buddleja alternifolia TaxID=168488 RepID=A0AAV6WGE7_9LAMI|nr:hypothetical protein BUALT_Bualt16G0075100 [Buddleja alternifolia]
MVMEHDENQEITSLMPVIPRLDRLDRLLQLLEEKHSLSRRDFSARSFASTTRTTATENKDDYELKTVFSALEEVQHKGTLVERLTALENRVLQLGLEMDEENTSKSSSSTVQVSELSIPKKQDENQEVSPKEMEDPRIIQTREGAASVDGFREERNGQLKSSGQKGRRRRKWLGWFRIRLRC